MYKSMIAVALGLALSGGALADSDKENEQEQELELEISEAVLNTDLSSASGMVYKDGRLYAVGDDSPWLFTLNKDFDIKDQYKIKDYPLNDDGRIVKSVKPDYEAMALVEDELKDWFLILGSGSKAEVREWAYMISMDQETEIEADMTALYSQLYTAGGFSGEEELNIEGLAIAKDKALVFNRGNSGGNKIFVLDKSELIAYVKGEITEVSDLKVYDVKLPTVDTFEAGLSGGEFWAKGDAVVYTASVEATGDAYNDGEILGSFVGLLPLDAFGEEKVIDLTANSVPLLDEDDKPLITKVESVAIYKSRKDEVKGALVSDNDDGTSEFFHFELEK